MGEVAVSFYVQVQAIVMYSFCSSSLVLINKLTMHHFPLPSTTIFVQLLATLLFICCASKTGLIEVDKWSRSKVHVYSIYCISFASGIYFNMKSLQASNIETVIVFRACSPLVVSLAEAAFMGRHLPSPRSMTALISIVLGAVLYARNDAAFNELGPMEYLYPFLYLVTISFSMTYGKVILNTAKMEHLWSASMYSNTLSIPTTLAFMSFGGEASQLEGAYADLSGTGLLLIVAGCLVGIGISYTGWYARDKLTATSFTLVGVMNKCVTVLVNSLIWDQHASGAGIMSLMICLGGGMMYQQAPMKEVAKTDDEDSV